MFITWWWLLITWDVSESVGDIWYNWLRTINLGIPILVLINIMVWKKRKERIVWALAFLGAPVFTTLIWSTWWLIRKIPDFWDSVLNFFQGLSIPF